MHSSDATSPMNWDSPEISALVRGALKEDIGSGDVTRMALVPRPASARARIIAKQELVAAGLPIAERVFRALDTHIVFTALAQEGAAVRKGETLAELSGSAAAVLSGERTALNFLARLCGIATLARKFVDALAGTRAQIRDTRKTTPLLRALEKYAVRTGGGANHRFGLYDAILIKENHIALAGGVKPALDRAHAFAAQAGDTGREMTAYESYRPAESKPSGQQALPVQIEVRDEAELREALSCGAEAILLDNQTPAEAARLVSMARRLRPDCVIEISGGITLSNVRAYAEAGADFLSSGALTHSAPAADLTLLVETIGSG
ncbi:MAG TPA: carboxylating nicotinate-nucleotide diphosphorylase [Candidatus Acidoferrales bacterium]